MLRRTLGHEAGLRRVKPWSWSVYRSNSGSAASPPSPPDSAPASEAAEAAGSCGRKGRAARSSEAADTALLVRSGGGEEAPHFGAVAWGGGGRWARPASFSGGPRQGQPTSVMGLQLGAREAFARGYGLGCSGSARYRHLALVTGRWEVGPLMAFC